VRRRRCATLRFSFLPAEGALTVLPRRLQVLLVATVVPVVAACAASPSMADAVQPVATVIVKPRVPATADEVTRAVQDALGRDAGVRYVRPLAGGAHMLHLTAPATREQVPALIEHLRKSGAFQYVELDSMMKIR
jgi:hypothetical protein